MASLRAVLNTAELPSDPHAFKEVAPPVPGTSTMQTSAPEVEEFASKAHSLVKKSEGELDHEEEQTEVSYAVKVWTPVKGERPPASERQSASTSENGVRGERSDSPPCCRGVVVIEPAVLFVTVCSEAPPTDNPTERLPSSSLASCAYRESRHVADQGAIPPVTSAVPRTGRGSPPPPCQTTSQTPHGPLKPLPHPHTPSPPCRSRPRLWSRGRAPLAVRPPG